jgi:hypothetical protein
LEKMLANSKVPGGSDDRLPFYAAEALAGIGKPGIAALIRRARLTGKGPIVQGRAEALMALGNCRDHATKVVPVLLEALDDEWVGGVAATSLGRLRPNSPRARQALKGARAALDRRARNEVADDLQRLTVAETKVAIIWALAQVGE